MRVELSSLKREIIHHGSHQGIVCHLIELGHNDTVAPRHVGTGGRRDAATHRFAILIDPPLRIGARDEATLCVPASDPVDTVVEEEKAELLGLGAFVQRSRKPAASLFELRLEHVAVEDAAIDQRGWGFFFEVASITLDEMPAPTGQKFVGSRDGSLPMLFSVGIVAIAITVSEPVCGATEGTQADKEVWSHDRR